MKKTLVLNNLCCASCASKIETQTKNLEGIDNAALNFVSKEMTVEIADEKASGRLLDEITDIIKKIEPDVRVSYKNSIKDNEHEKESGLRGKIISLAAGGAVFAAGIIFSFPDWIELAVFLVSYFILGADVIFLSLKDISRRQIFSENLLMCAATIGAFFIGEYAEGAAVMLFWHIGELFQDMAVDRSRRSIGALMDIRPDHANLKTGSILRTVSPEEVKIGDIIVVKPGEKIPLDGIVIGGTSMADTSALTGESVPRELSPGKEALSGFINKNGVLTVKVTKSYDESTVSKILNLVQNAGTRKASVENFITKFARYYTPVVVFGALAVALLPPLVIPGEVFSDWVYRALVFLLISCPCALVISIPLGFFGGIGGASKRGILIKGANYLEALNNAETVVFDKTGTLTKGVFKVTQINPAQGFTGNELLEYAAYAESYSNHPIAVSVLNAYNGEVDKSKIQNCREIAGYGIKTYLPGKEIIAGNAALMLRENIGFSQTSVPGSVVHIAVNRKYAGYIVISDEIREDSKRAVKELRALGVRKTVMLTGDVKETGDNIGRYLGIDEIYSSLLPAGKVEKIELLEKNKSSGGNIVFVGDGINDAPVLRRADIGIAMGGLGSDAAIEAADIVIMTDEPSKVATAIKIAHRTRNIVLQNIIFALGIKFLFLIFGAMGMASMWEAVFADIGVALIAILNAMRAMNTKKL